MHAYAHRMEGIKNLKIVTKNKTQVLRFIKGHFPLADSRKKDRPCILEIINKIFKTCLENLEIKKKKKRFVILFPYNYVLSFSYIL